MCLPPIPLSVYYPHVTKDGHANNTAAYLADSSCPTYKLAFQSGMPRLVALPGGGNQDTRAIHARTHEALCGSPPRVGPGDFGVLAFLGCTGSHSWGGGFRGGERGAGGRHI